MDMDINYARKNEDCEANHMPDITLACDLEWLTKKTSLKLVGSPIPEKQKLRH